MLSINTNISSLVAQQNLSNATNSLDTSLQRLSSGLKINTGADGPAAYVISQQDGAQVAGLQSAISNTSQAVSLVQTAEGALGTVSSLLVQMRGLALSAANAAVNDPTSLAADQAQIQNALQTINNISTNTQFGTKTLLDGTAAAQVTINSGSANVASITPGVSTQPGTFSATVVQAGQKAQLLGTSFTAATNSVTSQSGPSSAIAAGATATNSTYTGTYNVVVTQQGQDASVTGASAYNLGAAKTETLSISGGGLSAPVAVSLNGADSTGDNATDAAAHIQSVLQAATGGAAFTATQSGGVITINSNQYGGPISVSVTTPSGDGSGAGFGAVNNVSGATVGTTGALAQVQLSGGGLSAPVTLTSNAAGTFSGTGNATGLSFTLNQASPATTPPTSVAAGATASITVSGNSSLTLNGTQILLNAQNAGSLATAVSTIQSFANTTGVDASLSGSSLVLTAAAAGGNNFSFSAIGTTGITTGQAFAQNAQNLTVQLYNGSGNPLGSVLTGGGTDGLTITATPSGTTDFGGADGLSIDFAGVGASNGVNGAKSAASGSSTSFSIANGLTFQIGANENQTASVSIQSIAASDLGTNVTGLSNANTKNLADINVTTTSGAQDAVAVIDAAIDQVSSLSGALGAFQTNTLQATANNLQTALTNTSNAQSVITDTDFAAETANFTQAQVLVQAGTTVLANANATTQLILTLLKNS